MPSMSFRRRVAAPAAGAWAVISDVGNYSRVAPNIDHSRVVSGSGTRLIRQCSNSDGTWTELCTEWQEGERFSFEVDTQAPDYPYPFSKLLGTWAVAPISEDACELSMDFRFEFRDPQVERERYPMMKQQFSEVGERLLDNWQRDIEKRAT